jgi:hypothetical protein
MLDRLRGSEKTGVEGGGALEIRHHLQAFVDHSVNSVAGLAFCRAINSAKNPLEPMDLALGFSFVLLERTLQILRLRSLRHLRKRLHDLVFGVIDVLQGLVEEIIEPLVLFCYERLLLHAQNRATSRRGGGSDDDARSPWRSLKLRLEALNATAYRGMERPSVMDPW